MENRKLCTFTIADSEGLSEERVGYVAQEIAAKEAEKHNWETDYSLLLESVESSLKDKLYNYAVIALDGNSDQEDSEQESPVRHYSHSSVAAAAH